MPAKINNYLCTIGLSFCLPKHGYRKEESRKTRRTLLNEMADDMREQIREDIAALEPADRVKVFLKLCEFLVSKPQTVSLDLMAERKITIEDQLLKLSKE